MTDKITIVDYGRGNLHSVANALERLGVEVEITSEPAKVLAADKLILPGVGAFGDCMEQLELRGLTLALKNYLAGGKPFLGICLGMQLLFESSEESPGCAGLGFFKGSVKKLTTTEKIPHMGWNRLRTKSPSPLLKNANGAYVYFVHSFHCVPVDQRLVTSVCDYGQEVTASVGRGAVQAFQFHPEKSGRAGLGLLKNFIEL